MQYEKMNLELFGYKRDGETESFRLRVTSPLRVEQSYEDSFGVSFGQELRTRLRLLEERTLDAPGEQTGLIALGKQLGQLLFPGDLRQHLYDCLNHIGYDKALRIQLKTGSFGLANIPWEYVYVESPDPTAVGGFLALNKNISLVRYEIQAAPLGTLSPLPDIKPRLVALMADPGPPQYQSLKLINERKKMEEALEKLTRPTPNKTHYLDYKFYEDATITDLEDAIAEGIHVLYFAGHGSFKAEQGEAFKSIAGFGHIVIFDDDKKPREFSVESLVKNLNNSGIRLAVLGACETGRRGDECAWSGIAPALARANIPAVVAMQYKIEDKNAIFFSRAFYKSLAEHNSVDIAMTKGRLAIDSRSSPGERDWGVPVLYLRAQENDGVIFPSSAVPAVSRQDDFQTGEVGKVLLKLLDSAVTLSQGEHRRERSARTKPCAECNVVNPFEANFCMNCRAAFAA
jgi:hypothetical protein